MGVSALKWQGWLVALVFVAGLLVFAPLGLYVWAGGAPAARSSGAARGDVRITDCRIEPASRRVVASVEAVNGFPEAGAYVVTVEFREPPRAESGSGAPGSALPVPVPDPDPAPDPVDRGPQVLVKIPGVLPAATEHAEVVGPVWPPATIPWCGIAAAAFAPDPPFARSLGLRPRPHASNAGEAGSFSPSGV